MECYKDGAQMLQICAYELVRDLHSTSAEYGRGERRTVTACDRRSQRTGVQPYCSMWDLRSTDCLFFCINQDIYESLTRNSSRLLIGGPGQKAALIMSVYLNRSGDREIMSRWEKNSSAWYLREEDAGYRFHQEKAVDGIDDWLHKRKGLRCRL